VGLACAIKNCGIGNGLEEVSETKLKVLDPGRILLVHGWCEMGQGVHTVARQVLCEVAGLDDRWRLNRIRHRALRSWAG
jgi:aldehyde oxidoreductase